MEAVPPFGVLLRGYRSAAGFTQEELAARAGLSVRGLSDLERGVKTRPHRDTLHLLAEALALEPKDRETLLRVARQRASAPADQRQSTLPVDLTSFVGRQQEMATVLQLLDRTRLLTLTGVGGVGKTRLALQVAARLADRYRDGVWLVELAPVRDPDLVPHALATVLAVRGDGSRLLPEVLVAALRPQHLLLVLDNCEHLLDACAPLVEALLRGAPRLQVLATSRAALRCAGETTWRVPTLSLPAADQHPTLQALTHSEAVQLFVTRAGLAQPHFALSKDNAAAVAQVCRHLDGLPLALELAAARLDGLSVTDLAARLEQCFRLLRAGHRTAPPRQRTLQATVDWSYTLLTPAEQHLFARLSVFAGGFPLEAAEAVGAGGGIAPEDVPDLLLRLVATSLVQVEEGGEGRALYRLLETLRQYGRERLAARDEATAVRQRHAAYLLALAEQAAPQLHGRDQIAWLARLEAARDDLWAALRWVVDANAGEEAARLAWALGWFWYLRDPTTMGEWWRQVLAMPALAPPSRWRARMLAKAGFAHPSEATSRQLFEEALTLSRHVGDRLAEANVLCSHGLYLRQRGENKQARPLLEESLALYQALGDRGHEAVVLCELAEGACADGAYERARALVAQILALTASTGDHWRAAVAREILGQVAFDTGDLAAASKLWHRSHATYRAVGDRMGLAHIAVRLGRLASRQGRYDTARRHYAAGLKELAKRGCILRGLGWLADLVIVLVDGGHPAEGLRLAAASETLNAAYGVHLAPRTREERARTVTRARTELDKKEAAALWAAGQALTLEQAIMVAVQEPASHR